jgi:PAS domain S-box-containing protein
MRSFRSTIASKGLIMTAVPLLFQVVFLALLGWYMIKARAASDEFQRSQSMVSAVTRCSTVEMSSAVNFGGWVLLGDQDYYKYYSQALQETRRLREFVSKNKLIVEPEEQQLWHTYETLSDAFNGRFVALKELIDAGKTDEAKAIFTGHPSPVQTYFPPLRSTTAKILFFEQGRKPSKKLKEAGQDLIVCVSAGIAVNVILSILLLTYFSREFTFRIKTMMGNTARFVKGEALSPTLPGNDEIAALDAVFHDMAASINKSTERLKGLIENMLVGLVVIDHNGVIESVNPRSELLFMLSAADLVGKNISVLFMETKNCEPEDALKILKEKAVNKIGELEGARANGDQFPVEVTVCDLETAEGPRLLANILDVSQKKEVERIRREFVSTVTHELRTPLTSVRGGLTLLSAGALGELPAKAKDIVTMAERNTMRLLDLINDLLDIEKLEAGMLKMEIDEIVLDEVISRSMESIYTFASERKVEILPEQAPFTVSADKDRLVQVLVNLLSNAIKFSPAGGSVEIEIFDIGADVEIAVVDHGRGIPQSFKEKIFQRFQQASGDSKHKGGSGLGLAICKTIVELHGGQIGFDSEEGVGTRVWFRLPKHAEIITEHTGDQPETINTAVQTPAL